MNIVIVSPGMKHDGNTLSERSLGGSETAAIQLAEALAKIKDAFGNRNRVVVLSNCEKPVAVKEVLYIPIGGGPELLEAADVDLLIVSRAQEPLMQKHNAKVCFYWCHDLALKRFMGPIRTILSQVDRLLVMSEFQKAQYKEVYEIPDSTFEVTRNGIDLDLFLAPGSRKRERGQMVYCARPERGLENLVKPDGIMEKLYKAGVPVTLSVAHYDNTTQEAKPYYDMLWARCEELPNVHILGNLTKKALYDLYARAWLYIYPTEFEEISCITAMETQACGLPMLTCPVAALPETLHPDAAQFIEGNASEPEVQDLFVEAVRELLGDEEGWKAMSVAGFKNGIALSWEEVGKQLLDASDKIMRERSSDPARLYKHFFQMSDIEMCNLLEEACNTLAGAAPEQDHPLRLAEKEVAYVHEKFAFMKSPEAYRAHNIEVDGPVEGKPEFTGATVAHFDTVDNEPRWLALKEFLQQNGMKYRRILDYGCWIGHQTIRMANLLPHAQVVGVDITANNIKIAGECVEKYSKHKNVEFRTLDEMGDASLGENEFDFVICNEVLEHVLSPYRLITLLESACKQGGTIFMTTPYGPWEYQSYFTFPHRCHVRHFEMNDLLDVFGDKKDCRIFFKAFAQDDRQRAMGHHYVSYTNDAAVPTGVVNLHRKMVWQAPRETLAVCMIAYNAEAMLHRCLKSVRALADEIIIVVDPKTSDSTRQIAAQYGAELREGIDPLIHGFGAMRNLSIKDVKSDWIFWIDSDEELLHTERMHKYLRPNVYKAYGIQQHHLSVDPPKFVKPDLPTRLFRNNLGMKFFGLVHEHPELDFNKGTGLQIIIVDAWIAHDGYLTNAVRKGRFLRNLDLVLRDYKENPDRELMKFLFLRDCIQICRIKMERLNGQGPNAECRQWAMLAKEVFEKKIINDFKSALMVEALEYYSTANALLNLGHDMIFSLNVNGAELRDVKARFPNSEIASKFFEGLVKFQQGQFEGKYI